MSASVPERVRRAAISRCGARTRYGLVCRPGAAVQITVVDGATMGYDDHVWIPSITATRGSGLAGELVTAVYECAREEGWGLLVTPILDQAVGFWERMPFLVPARDEDDPFRSMVAAPPWPGPLDTHDLPAGAYVPILLCT